jgi:hypothetical protein
MPERVGVKVRCLPDGEFRDALQTASDGRFFELDVTADSFALGSLLEIEKGSMLYWGELKQFVGPAAFVLIEHSLDRSRLQPIRDIWGD